MLLRIAGLVDNKGGGGWGMVLGLGEEFDADGSESEICWERLWFGWLDSDGVAYPPAPPQPHPPIFSLWVTLGIPTWRATGAG